MSKTGKFKIQVLSISSINRYLFFFYQYYLHTFLTFIQLNKLKSKQ